MNCHAFLFIAFLQAYQSWVSFTAVDSTVKLTSTMGLKCVFPKNGSISLIEWKKEKDDKIEKIAVFRLPYDLHIASNYTSRVQVENLTSNNKSLLLSNTTEEDVGFYLCSFHVYPYGIWQKRVHVVQSGDFELPINPDHYVTTEPGKNATLSYWYDSDVAVDQVTWERVQQDCVDFIVQCAKSQEPIRGKDYKHRIETDCASQAKSSIVLVNVTVSDSGMYRYSYKVNDGNGTGWIKVTVKSPAFSLSKEQILLFCGITIATLLLIIVVIVVLHCRRKKERIKKMRDYIASRKKPFHEEKKWDGYNSADAKPTPTAAEDPMYVNKCKPNAVYVNELSQFMPLVSGSIPIYS